MKVLDYFFLALGFLTVIPTENFIFKSGRDMSGSLYFFPVVGLVIGLILAVVSWGVQHLGLGMAGDALTIVALIILTGGLHLDGLMDTADGIFSGQPREQKLKIMRDSGVGAMGIAVFASVLVLKIFLLLEIPLQEKLKYLVLVPVAGRWAMVFAICKFPYARSQGGLGSIFSQEADDGKLMGATVIFITAAVFCLGIPAVFLIFLVLLVTIAAARFMANILGGLTGDCYGALCEVVETWTLFIGAVFRYWI